MKAEKEENASEFGNYPIISEYDAVASADTFSAEYANNVTEPDSSELNLTATHVLIPSVTDAAITIQQIYNKYAEDPYMMNRAHSYICNQLPNIFENMKKTHHLRQIRMEELTCEQDLFIHSFLNHNQYFYMASTEKFYYYDGVHYQIYNEDNILYNVLSSITRGGQLMSWKQRTKINIMKRIKDNNLLKTVPESETIQSVLDLLYPALFQTKSEAKYFLTVLGDNIFKKNGELIHFVHPTSKKFIQELNNYSQAFIGLNLSNTFKYKYHEHEYSSCRLVKMNDGVKQEHLWSSILMNSALDLICVACHYSTRYNSSDEYVLYANNDDILTTNVFYLKNVTQSDLVDMFIREYLETATKDTNIHNNILIHSTIYTSGHKVPTRQTSASASICLQTDEINESERRLKNRILNNSEPTNMFIDNPVQTPPTNHAARFSGSVSTQRTGQIQWKNMFYLWKQFLDSKNLPTIMFQQTLKGFLIQKLSGSYNEELDLFVGIYSKYLPAIQKFLAFWEETITYIDVNSTQEQEFEIDEICMLYKQWCQTPSTVQRSVSENIQSNNSGRNVVISSLDEITGASRSASVGERLNSVAFGTEAKEFDTEILATAKVSEPVHARSLNISDRQILDLISYFFPMVEIEREKFIYKIKCSLWDKNADIQNAIDNMNAQNHNKHVELLRLSPLSGHKVPTKEFSRSPSPCFAVATARSKQTVVSGNLQLNTDSDSLNNCVVSVYDAYIYYCKSLVGHGHHKQVVSKAYFEKYLSENIDIV